jgi:hypothetical protein
MAPGIYPTLGCHPDFTTTNKNYGSDAPGSGLNLTGLEDLSGLVTVTTSLCITTNKNYHVPKARELLND